MLSIDDAAVNGLALVVADAATTMNVSLGPGGLAADQIPVVAFGHTSNGPECHYVWTLTVAQADHATRNMRLALESDVDNLGLTVSQFREMDDDIADELSASLFEY